MIDYLKLIQHYFSTGSPAYRIYLIHVTLVTAKALQIARQLNLDTQTQILIEQAAMLHDIGIVRTDATAIGGRGTQPYIAHGVLGAQILREAGLENHALVAERHVGVGLRRDYIIAANLPLPHQDFIPQTLPEKIITYADCFYSKNPDTLWIPETPEKIIGELQKYRHDDAQTFARWAQEFEGLKINY